MAKSTTCACGGSYDNNAVCINCGKKRPRSTSYRVWHSFLCVIAILFLLGCMSTSISVRHYLHSDTLIDSLEEARFSDANIPFTGQTAAEFLYDEFVDDEKITVDDMAKAIDSLELPEFAAAKLDQYFDLLRGDSDTAVKINVEEIIDLLEAAEPAIYDSCMLIIEDHDKETIRLNAEGPFNTINSLSDFFYGSKAMRALSRFQYSIGAIILQIVLLALVLWRWCVVMRNSGKSASKGVHHFGMSILVPSIASLLCCLIGAAFSLFAKDGVIGIHDALAAIRAPFWTSSILGILAGVALLFAAAIIVRAGKPRKQPAEPVIESVPTPAAMPAPETAKATTHCRYCKRTIAENASFCIYCGKPQNAPEPSVEEAVSENVSVADTPIAETTVAETPVIPTETPVEPAPIGAPEDPSEPTV